MSPSYITPGENRTHYVSADIDVLIQEMVALVHRAPQKWTFKASGSRKSIGLRYAKVGQSAWGPRRGAQSHKAKVNWWPEQYVCRSFSPRRANLGVLRKKHVDALQPDLVRLAGALDEVEVLPDEAAAQIAAVGASMVGLRLTQKYHRKRLLSRVATILVREARKIIKRKVLTIRVRSRVLDPIKRKRLTPVERAAHWAKFYLEGRWAKKLAWRREEGLKPAIRRYAEAWRDTTVWLDKARGLGADPTPHKTPAEVLRELADEWEKEGRLR